MGLTIENSKQVVTQSQKLQKLQQALNRGNDPFSEFKSILDQVASAVQQVAGSSVQSSLEIPLSKLDTESKREDAPVEEREEAPKEEVKATEKEQKLSKREEDHDCRCVETEEEVDENEVEELHDDVQMRDSHQCESKESEEVEVEVEVEAEAEAEAEEVLIVDSAHEEETDSSQEEETQSDEVLQLLEDELVPETEEMIENESIAQASSGMRQQESTQEPVLDLDEEVEQLEEEVVLETNQEQGAQELQAETQYEQEVSEGDIDVSDLTLEESEVLENPALSANVSEGEGSEEASDASAETRMTIEKLLRQAAKQGEGNQGERQDSAQSHGQGVGQELSTQIKQLIDTMRQGTESAKSGGHGQQISQQAKAVNASPSSMAGMMTEQKNAEETAQSKESKSLPRTLQQKTIAKIEEVLKEVSSSKKGKTLSVRLDPPRLGSVRIEATIQDGNLNARIVAENPQVQQLLKEKGLELQQMLRRLGLNLDQVTVTVGGDHESAGKDYFQEQMQERAQAGLHESLHVEGDVAVAGNPHKSNTNDYWVA